MTRSDRGCHVRVVGGLAAMLVVTAALASCGPGGDEASSDPEVASSDSPATPTPSPDASSDGPSASPAPEESTTTPALPSRSTNVTPVCGEPFTLPEQPAQLQITLDGDISEAAGEPSYLVAPLRVTNIGADGTGGHLPLETGLVVTDASGAVVVVTLVELEGEGNGTTVVLAPNDDAVLRGVARVWGVDGECSASADRLLPPGDYQVYAVGDVRSTGGPVEQQAQGGPWPYTVTEAPPSPEEPTMTTTTAIEGAAAIWECGAELGNPDTGITLASGEIRSPRTAADDISSLDITLTTDRDLDGVNAGPDLVLTRDGVVVTERTASDYVLHLQMSAGTSTGFPVGHTLVGCDGEALPAGTYEAYAVLGDDRLDPTTGEWMSSLIARGEAQTVVLEP